MSSPEISSHTLWNEFRECDGPSSASEELTSIGRVSTPIESSYSPDCSHDSFGPNKMVIATIEELPRPIITASKPLIRFWLATRDGRLLVDSSDACPLTEEERLALYLFMDLILERQRTQALQWAGSTGSYYFKRFTIGTSTPLYAFLYSQKPYPCAEQLCDLILNVVRRLIGPIDLYPGPLDHLITFPGGSVTEVIYALIALIHDEPGYLTIFPPSVLSVSSESFRLGSLYLTPEADINTYLQQRLECGQGRAGEMSLIVAQCTYLFCYLNDQVLGMFGATVDTPMMLVQPADYVLALLHTRMTLPDVVYINSSGRAMAAILHRQRIDTPDDHALGDYGYDPSLTVCYITIFADELGRLLGELYGDSIKDYAISVRRTVEEHLFPIAEHTLRRIYHMFATSLLQPTHSLSLQYLRTSSPGALNLLLMDFQGGVTLMPTHAFLLHEVRMRMKEEEGSVIFERLKTSLDALYQDVGHLIGNCMQTFSNGYRFHHHREKGRLYIFWLSFVHIASDEMFSEAPLGTSRSGAVEMSPSVCEESQLLPRMEYDGVHFLATRIPGQRIIDLLRRPTRGEVSRIRQYCMERWHPNPVYRQARLVAMAGSYTEDVSLEQGLHYLAWHAAAMLRQRYRSGYD
ncbi:hypothetical protein GMRT_14126 [Giardia muris]|uniref:Uncharacterized protein n=1 Tax=Giardia muris TaxID=5742 RepID=A0A4Z1STL8_GIAMU|nr:hypothetical protein GMRT_14126 [Giardia muris]|eukprot:TNJ28335.1 hypothetical protein GMRT_14126 [Giardia muris]